MECEPTDSDDVANVACPFASGTVASVVEPSVNVTVPVGVPLPEEGVTETANVTDAANTEGFAVEVIVVVVAG